MYHFFSKFKRNISVIKTVIKNMIAYSMEWYLLMKKFVLLLFPQLI